MSSRTAVAIVRGRKEHRQASRRVRGLKTRPSNTFTTRDKLKTTRKRIEFGCEDIDSIKNLNEISETKIAIGECQLHVRALQIRAMGLREVL